MPIAPKHAFKEKPTQLLIFYPSEPFTIAHFNVRHPVYKKIIDGEVNLS